MEYKPEKIKGEHLTGCIESATALKKFRKPLVEYLISGLEEKDKWVRCMAAGMLGDLGDSRAVDSLKPLLADPDPDLRAVAAYALDMICYNRAPVDGSRTGICEHCMVRFIADEALNQMKSQTESSYHAYWKGETAYQKEFPDNSRV
ncbi:MAG: HEAT repeat domain-containing protein [Methanoregula sp.]|nr:MAG: HEAT repeat domain-containing protein [Methanoregula sp.]